MHLNIDRSNWTKVKLGEVVEWYQKDIPNDLQSEQGIEYYLTASEIDGDEVKISRYKELRDGQKGPTITKRFEKGDLLLSTRSVALRKAAIAPVSGVTGEKLLVLRCIDGGQLVPKLMPFVFQSAHFWHFAQNSASGSVNKFTSWTKLANYEFLLPPKDQQAELAELLWAMDFEVESKISLMNTTTAFVESKLKALLMGEVQTTRRETKLGPINADWECHTLETLIKRETISSHLDGNHGSYYPRSEEFVDNGVPYVSANCIDENEISLANAKYLTEDRAATIKKGVALNGDILLAHNATVGPVAKLQTKLEKVILGTSLTYYRVNENKMNSDYLFYFMKSRLFQAQLEKVMSQSTRNQVPITTQRSLLFIVPPISTQNHLVSELNRIDHLRKELKMMVRKSKSLQKSIINQII